MDPTGVTSFDEAMVALHAALPGVTEDLDSLSGSQVASMLKLVAGFAAAVEAARLRLVAAAEATAAHRVVGARDTAELVADVCGQRLGAARKDAETAVVLADRHRSHLPLHPTRARPVPGRR